MNRRDVERFFRILDGEYRKPLRVLLIGGGASIVQAGPRFTEDLDFEARASLARPVEGGDREALLRAIETAKTALGIKAQFADDIEHWSMIPWPEHRKRSRLWKRFGKCEVWLLEPEVYAVSKLARGMETDHDDVVKVMRKRPVPWRTFATLAGEALRTAPMSDVLHLFRDQVERFLRGSGPKLWGRGFDPEAAISVFLKAARARKR